MKKPTMPAIQTVYILNNWLQQAYFVTFYFSFSEPDHTSRKNYY